MYDYGVRIALGNHWLFRYTLGWLLPQRIVVERQSYDKTKEQSARKQVYQDIGFPMKEQKMVNLSHDLFGIYPLLCYPCKISSRRGFLIFGVNAMKQDGKDHSSFKFSIYGVPKAILEARGLKILENWKVLFVELVVPIHTVILSRLNQNLNHVQS